MQKGQYSIDEDGYIKLHSMKDSGGRKCDAKRLKIGGTSSRLTLSGKFDNNSSNFVSDITPKGKPFPLRIISLLLLEYDSHLRMEIVPEGHRDSWGGCCHDQDRCDEDTGLT